MLLRVSEDVGENNTKVLKEYQVAALNVHYYFFSKNTSIFLK
jgi:hypothetical protein